MRHRAARLIRIVAALLAVCLASLLLIGCFTAAILAVDILKARGGSYYDRLSDAVVGRAKALLVGEKPLQSEASQRQFLSNQLAALRDAQLAVDDALLAELDSGAYTLEQPLIVVNPYGLSPLSAIMLFETVRPATLSIHIDGDTDLAAVDYTFASTDTRHAIPVYGLYAGRENPVTVSARTDDGGVYTATHAIRTDPLPDFLSHERVRANVLDEAAYQPGFTFTYRGNNAQHCRAALDANGEYRWCLDTSSNALLGYMGFCGSYNGGNSVFLSVGNIHYGPVGILEFSLLGKLLHAWYAPYGAHHDIEVTDDSLWITGSASRDDDQALVYAINRQTGEIDRVLDYSDILQPTRNQTRDYPALDNFYDPEDWCHINSVATCGNDLIVSCRHQSSVVCNDASGHIKWILGDPEGYFASFKPYLLTPVGEDFGWFYTQHAAEALPDQDGDPDTVDILLFDNGDFRADVSKRASRMAQYRVNSREMTVALVWSYGDGMRDTYSYRHGDADLLPNGNRLGSFEPHDEKSGQSYAYGIEVDARGEPVWECWRVSTNAARTYGEYRLDRLEIYAESANDLGLGVPAALFLPEIE